MHGLSRAVSPAEKEREDAERELLEWDETEKAPAAVKVNEKKQRKKAAKKVKEQVHVVPFGCRVPGEGVLGVRG